MPFRHAIVIGASSGIGAEITALLAEDGCRVAAVARRLDRLEQLAARFPDRVLPFAHDVTRYEEVPALFQEITGRLGGLDLVLYASGVMPEVGEEEFSFEKDHRMIEVNLLGAIAWLNQAAIRFQNTGSGTLVGIGSVAGDRGRYGQPVYNASKAALATYLEALRNRLDRRGVTVVTINPGPVQTEMTAHLHLKGALPARRAAEILLRKSETAGEHYLLPQHRLIFAIIRALPSWLFRKLRI
ncbi:MAG TPA: SDR family NAD(P)-dependent oxidoreductase [Armatimonadota bacterium]|nr:SDR family NAD(P)-dependent oxidoreductase [Armatimonadota bacterium]